MHKTLATTVLASALALALPSTAPAQAVPPVPTHSRVIPAPLPKKARAAIPPPADPRLKRTQISPTDASALPTPPSSSPSALEAAGRPITLQLALTGSLANNPDLVALRNNNIASAEAVEVARHFPTALNPTVWVDYRPITLIPHDPFGGGAAKPGSPYYHHGQSYFLISIRQPIELGHQTTHRHEIARAALTQQQWTVVQAELLDIVQTYRFFQTAAYRREKLRVAARLAEFNDRLLQALNKRLESNQIGAADVVLAEVESQATRQLVDVARQDYANALADLRNQIGMPENAATAEPLGDFVLPRNIPPLDEDALIQTALASRPEIQAAKAQARGSAAAVNLARGDRIPTPVVGPQYVGDEAGIQYVGLIFVSAIPILNNGKPLVLQREADLRRSITNVQQIEKRTVIQVRAAASKWNAANRLVNQTAGLAGSLRTQVDRMERLFDANQAPLQQLLLARQRLIQLENAELDALWQATQSQADLLTAMGAPALIASLHEPAPAPKPTAAPTPR